MSSAPARGDSTPVEGPRDYTGFVDATALLDWFAAAKRNLPWREPFPRNPYHVLVSEVMAQQTQIERVIPAYLRFVDRFPTIDALARATEDDVVAAFSGLGYYRRARLLHSTAQAVASLGAWPQSFDLLADLPGLGPYSAAAIAAFAFAADTPPVDGNIARVASRFMRLELPLGHPQLLAAGRDLAGQLHRDQPRPEVFEALMELGATVCAPASARCLLCPLQPRCASRDPATALRYPLPRGQRARERVCWVVLWLERPDGQVLLRKIETGPILRGLWLPPLAELPDGVDGAARAKSLAASLGWIVPLAPRPALRHTITHRAIVILPFSGALGARVAERSDGVCWASPDSSGLPTSSLLAKLAQACTGAPTHTESPEGYPT